MANIVEAKIRIGAQLDQALTALRGLRREMQALGADTEAASKPVPVNARTPEALRETGRAARELRGHIGEATRALVAFFGAQLGADAARSVALLSDAYQGMRNRLKVTTENQQAFNEALQLTAQLSRQFSANEVATGRLVERIYAAVKPLGGSLEDARTLSEALLASLRLSGASAEEAASAILQFSQSIGKGVLNGDEFRAVFESAPRLIYAMAEASGQSAAALKQMGEEGRLSTAFMVQALGKALPQLKRQSAEIAPTLGESFTAVSNGLQRYLNSSETARAITAGLGQALRGLAESIGTVVAAVALLAGGLAALGFARAVAGVASLVSALTAAGGLTAALSGALAVLGGPVGLVAMLAALAAGWVAVSRASRQAANSTLEGLANQRAAVLEEINDLERRASDRQKLQTVYLQSRRQLQGDLDRIDARIARLREDQLRAQAGPRGGPGLEQPAQSGLQDPATVEAFERENQTRNAIAKRYADKRAAYEVAKDKEIAALRAKGDESGAQREQQQKQEALKRSREREEEELSGLSAQAAATRLAQYVESYDAIAAIGHAATEAEITRVKEQYEAQLISTQDYFARRAKLESAAAAETAARIEEEIAQRQRVLAINEQRAGRAAGANAREAAAQAVQREQEAIRKLTIERTELEVQAAQAARSLALEEAAATRELQRQAELRALEVKAANDLLTLDDIRRRVALDLADQRRKEQQETGGTAQTDALIAARTRAEQLAQLQRELATLEEARGAREQQIAQDVEQGRKTATQAEQEVLALRREQVRVLDELLAKLAAIAATPAERSQVEKARAAVGAIREQATELDKAVRGAGKTGLAQFFDDVTTGAKDAGDAFKDFALSVARTALNLINQRLAEQIIDSIIPKGGTTPAGAGASGGFLGSVGNFIASLFHTGGVVGQASGSGARRAPAALWALAPRMHTGGLIGPDERPIIGKVGEEVLTEDNPRHIRNFRGAGIGSVNIQTTVQAAGGTAAEQRRVSDELGQRVRAVVDQWAVEQSRPGGILAGG